MSKITILTPTLNRSPRVLKRCIASVDRQTSGDWVHLVCSDGVREPAVEALLRQQAEPRRRYSHTPAAAGHYGAGVRAFLLAQVRTEYVAFLDDDNLLFPRFCERMAQALDARPEAGFAVCQIVHCGPLLPEFGLPPAVLTGIPPVPNHIDTLQVVARSAALRVCGWKLAGYGSDGATYERLGRLFDWVEVPEVLAMHV